MSNKSVVVISKEKIQPEQINYRDVSMVKYGKDYIVGALFTYLLFLNTYFPHIWKQEYAKALRFAHPSNYFDNAKGITNEEDIRKRSLFHGFKYMLGLYDWDLSKGCQIEPFPSCYDLPEATFDNYQQVLDLFRQSVFTKVWYSVVFIDQEQNKTLYSMNLIETTKKALEGKTLACFTHPEEDLRNPYANGIRFHSTGEMLLPNDCVVKRRSFMRFLDCAGFFVTFDKFPSKNPNPFYVDESTHLDPQTIDKMNRISFKVCNSGLYTQFSRVWILNEEKSGGIIRPDMVIIKKNVGINAIHLFLRLIHDMREIPGTLNNEVSETMEKLGLFDISHLEHDFGNFKIPKKEPKTIKKRKIQDNLVENKDVSKNNSLSHLSKKEKLRACLENASRMKQMFVSNFAGNININIPTMDAGFPFLVHNMDGLIQQNSKNQEEQQMFNTQQ